MTTNRELNRAIDNAVKILADAKAKIGISTDNNGSDNNNSKREDEHQKILELGRLTQIYESNLNTITNYLPNVPAKDLERYPDYYSKMQQNASREISEYEDMMTIAEANAAKDGLANPKQAMAEYAQECKQLYLNECKQKVDRLKQIKIIIHNDGTITSIDSLTGETANYDNQFNPLD